MHGHSSHYCIKKSKLKWFKVSNIIGISTSFKQVYNRIIEGSTSFEQVSPSTWAQRSLQNTLYSHAGEGFILNFYQMRRLFEWGDYFSCSRVSLHKENLAFSTISTHNFTYQPWVIRSTDHLLLDHSHKPYYVILNNFNGSEKHVKYKIK